MIKSLGETFADVRGVAGGAILGDGRVGLILDAGGVIGLLTVGNGDARDAGGDEPRPMGGPKSTGAQL